MNGLLRPPFGSADSSIVLVAPAQRATRLPIYLDAQVFCQELPLAAGAVVVGTVTPPAAEVVGGSGSGWGGPALAATVVVSGAGAVALVMVGAAAATGGEFAAVRVHQPLTTDSA